MKKLLTILPILLVGCLPDTGGKSGPIDSVVHEMNKDLKKIAGKDSIVLKYNDRKIVLKAPK